MKYLNIHDYISNYDLHVLEYHPSVGFYYYKYWTITNNRMLRAPRTRYNRWYMVKLFDRYFQNRMVSVKE